MPQQHMQFGIAIGTSVGTNGGERGKRNVVVEDPLVVKATQQKQRRMIKNRELGARSRERKQEYTVKLEALLIQNVMPVLEKRRPSRVLRRTN
ncbi:hypothetical protein L1887_03282 [Cichorium endivia]|nr:hypothetical protein L1887_03282 [Cichorium endivia]